MCVKTAIYYSAPHNQANIPWLPYWMVSCYGLRNVNSFFGLFLSLSRYLLLYIYLTKLAKNGNANRCATHEGDTMLLSNHAICIHSATERYKILKCWKGNKFDVNLSLIVSMKRIEPPFISKIFFLYSIQEELD